MLLTLLLEERIQPLEINQRFGDMGQRGEQFFLLLG
ncbi:hypothetical protein METH_20340 [Leisingera methylohalidivorans DSM 14336]|uniref:Uncharacterized protein n=1 Tax=Leisingera methylohalidivorans DSM 14336 TaxID=999552 RepID=V9W297_9RHOB|nr:hypothetical protein METH_20340 [Leisingera methylohalidivorans DSM 14336]